ncbi:TetR/AcrR family transcriptional regulator [Clostridium sp. JS66]|uniref:TetR/AcrR family transcriptional regulator n=1 Tax=Clostridium sp. JS66 TaxID=3064705 RepID=UPI00298D830D|nr:TetR/AcrR family transcriptional regulator [Clostridium sp. JS66]WPC42733.1 TetR/AcrR family transcriptional regulator [Clostridium sp. JS66]
MSKGREIYKPKQKRSEATMDKILDTALKLFGQKGYYNVSTNEIAKETNISIGNLYFYFPNKEEIFIQILDRYYRSFVEIHEVFLKEIDTLEDNPKVFLRRLMEIIIKKHEESLELNREIRILALSNFRVENIVKRQQEQLKKIAIDYFEKYAKKDRLRDIEATIEIIFILLDSVIDEIAFSKNIANKERLLSEALNVVEVYLLD